VDGGAPYADEGGMCGGGIKPPAEGGMAVGAPYRTALGAAPYDTGAAPYAEADPPDDEPYDDEPPPDAEPYDDELPDDEPYDDDPPP